MDYQVSWADLVGQPLPSYRSLVWRSPGLSGGSHSSWELWYEGAMTELPLGCNFRQLTFLVRCYFINCNKVQFNLKSWVGLDLESGPFETGKTVPVVLALLLCHLSIVVSPSYISFLSCFHTFLLLSAFGGVEAYTLTSKQSNNGHFTSYQNTQTVRNFPFPLHCTHSSIHYTYSWLNHFWSVCYRPRLQAVIR